jgi:hypothetical protein
VNSQDMVCFIDGISSIATHNGVHRIIFYKLTADQRPEPTVELVVPDSSLRGIVDAMARVSRGGR